MSDVHVDYLSTDALTEGVGASQVLAYVERLPSRGVGVTLHSFEKEAPPAALRARLDAAGVLWLPLPFGRFGAAGGLKRLVDGARAVRGATLVHARADLAAASVLVSRQDQWLWDCRGLFADQRLALGTLRAGSPEHRVLRRVERASARGASAIVTLTAAVIPVLEERYGPGVAPRCTVIPTCVDTARFAPVPLPDRSTIELLLSGTINRYYDVPAMVALVRALRSRRPTNLVVAAPTSTAWDRELADVATSRVSVAPDAVPAVVAASHAGLSVCRDDAGISLTGSMPTKIAEFLAMGRPVVVNRLLGDAATLVTEHRAGVVLDAGSPGGVERAADELESLLADPELSARCRALAESHFDLERAVDGLAAVYRSVAGA